MPIEIFCKNLKFIDEVSILDFQNRRDLGNKKLCFLWKPEKGTGSDNRYRRIYSGGGLLFLSTRVLWHIHSYLYIFMFFRVFWEKFGIHFHEQN